MFNVGNFRLAILVLIKKGRKGKREEGIEEGKKERM